MFLDDCTDCKYDFFGGYTLCDAHRKYIHYPQELISEFEDAQSYLKDLKARIQNDEYEAKQRGCTVAMLHALRTAEKAEREAEWQREQERKRLEYERRQLTGEGFNYLREDILIDSDGEVIQHTKRYGDVTRERISHLWCGIKKKMRSRFNIEIPGPFQLKVKRRIYRHISIKTLMGSRWTKDEKILELTGPAAATFFDDKRVRLAWGRCAKGVKVLITSDDCEAE